MKKSLNDQWLERLKAVECRDSTYAAKDPCLVMSKGRGSLVYDADGNELIDLCAGFGALALGHNPEAHAAVYQRRLGNDLPPIGHGMGDVYPSIAKVEVIEALLELLPEELSRAALALTGAQAVEIAVKTAMLATKRSGFIAFDGGYHGLDLGVLPLTSRANFREPFQDYCAKDRVESLPFLCSEAELEEAVARLQARGAGFAAIIVEPVQGRAGVRQASTAWLETLRAIADRHDALLIYDEVFTGLGRTGQLTFASTVPADLVCFGKALGGGYPLSACVGTGAAMDAWPESVGEALHTGTFFGHPFTCEMAKATLDELASANLAARADHLGNQARLWLTTALGAHPAVKEVRGVGLMIGIEFHEAGFGATMMDKLRGQGVLALASGDRGETLSITPALTIPWDLLVKALAKVAHAVALTGSINQLK